MPVSVRKCPQCSSDNHYRRKVCVQCGTVMTGKKGRPTGSRTNVCFDESIVLLMEWDHSKELVNISCSLLDVCSRRIAQQCTFEKKPLGLAVCYGCGHLLWSTVDGAHTFLVDKPSGMSEQQGSYMLRGVRQLKSDGTPVPIVSPILFHPSSTLGVSLMLVRV